MNAWLHAVRPKTLVAGAAPVILGTALAFADGVVHWPSVPLIIVCSVLIQIASNFINELEDFKRGADERRVGPVRAVSAGLITPRSMRNASIAVVLLAFVLGLPLAYHSGWEVLVMGVACLTAAWAYTGGPFPLAYRGLGDVFAFVFFGLIAVTGTYFVHARAWSMDALVLSVGPGLLAANILGVNNIRDIPTDAAVGKRTFAVRVGSTTARWVYILFTATAVIVPSVILGQHRGPWLLLPLVSIPFGAVLCTMVLKRHGAELNTVLANTAVFYLVWTVLMAVGIGVSY
ncbi:MAG: 1,4-dihydroxy-2-naphthoate polyprenyltransferase [Candidatus Kapabacteria bacterium]|nr:1,4-dihydroxy-2-naphthoate polyprenyltransferase [Candidatus Kapabacteria bacterium]